MRLAVIFISFAFALQAQTATPAMPAASLNPDATLPAQAIGPNDLLWISVEDCPELTRNFRVSSTGMLALPLLHEKIQVAGKYPAEIENAITEALVKDDILVRPVVTVSVAEYRSVPVSVLGAVKRPITFQAVGNITLLDALTKAEGLTPDAGPEILVSKPHRAEDGESTGLVQRIPVKGLIDEANPLLNVRLFGGEEIRVPPAGRVYVVGNVKKSGSFPIQDGNDTTVLKVIALSEGLMPYSNKEAYIYRREGGKENRDEIAVDLNRILERKAPDVRLQANDILYIPDNKGRKLAAQTLDRIAGFGTSTASGVLIWH
ncbi:MAG: polysaccharide biosynthesis/export family protein [Acidobacteriaceae bacterium]|nr:polysaccharide biosynthesis/export family protein [Acidobacteriaceae bacterium]